MSKKFYDDDDGRTIADMSSLDRPPMFIPKFPKRDSSEKNHEITEGAETNERPWENNEMSREERKAYVFGALKATLIIAGVFLAGIAITIWIMLAFWT
ncbi:MAG TPA: hypothetical protein GXZ23_04790 [Clostridiales bacterium]|mgnify:CR=1 FL=1|nr:hypothetical protein [Clostridiales bacterium]